MNNCTVLCRFHFVTNFYWEDKLGLLKQVNKEIKNKNGKPSKNNNKTDHSCSNYEYTKHIFILILLEQVHFSTS